MKRAAVGISLQGMDIDGDDPQLQDEVKNLCRKLRVPHASMLSAGWEGRVRGAARGVLRLWFIIQ